MQLKHKKLISLGLIALLVINLFLGFLWSFEPNATNIRALSEQSAEQSQRELVTGYATVTALIFVGETLLDKNGGYLSNDITPPSIFLDNMPAWELGVINQIRDLSLIMRKDYSRSQSQSTEHEDLKIAQPKFNIDHTSWQFPSAEGEYRQAINALARYRDQLSDPLNPSAQFYARADNLVVWLDEVQSRLGSLSQRLAASVGREQLDTSLAGEAGAVQSTFSPSEQQVKTPWLEIDNVFFEARGEAWALLHFLEAVAIDFDGVLEKKNARVAVEQIIRELQSTQDTVWSPVILNGSGFGLMANHSLVMANYISRANAACQNLIEVLQKG